MVAEKLHKLKYWRGRLGLKQEDLATLLGYTVSNYCLKENGNTEIKRGEMLKIQKALNDQLKKAGQDPLTLDDIFLP